jgi:hypothetical protein
MTKILRGAAHEIPSRVEYEKTAQALGLTISPTLLAKRNQTIEREPPCQTITGSAHGMAVCAIRCLGDLDYLASAWSRTP